MKLFNPTKQQIDFMADNRRRVMYGIGGTQMNRYNARQPLRGDMCRECGEHATIVYVADHADYSGYIDEIPLCNEHADEWTEEYGGDYPSVEQTGE